jgi:hypothetical protein
MAALTLFGLIIHPHFASTPRDEVVCGGRAMSKPSPPGDRRYRSYLSGSASLSTRTAWCEPAAHIRRQGRMKPPQERRDITPSYADIPSAFEAGSPHSVPVGSQVDLSDLKIKPE